jgi:phosphopantothenoylcysteine decarboxylase
VPASSKHEHPQASRLRNRVQRPPVLHLTELLRLLLAQQWECYVIVSRTAATWVDARTIAAASGHPVRAEPRLPEEPDPLPPADAITAGPLTFNRLNKWAAGISDTLALGLLNEALELELAVVAAPCVKQALRRHPVYVENVRRLKSAGAKLLDPDDIIVRQEPGIVTFDWPRIIPT